MPDQYYDKQITLYNKLYRGFLLGAVLCSFIGICLGVWKVFDVGGKIDQNVINTQIIIRNNQTSALQAREANIDRQEDLENYVKCLSLLRFDNPELGPTSTREQVETALDRCAKVRQ